MRIDDLGWMDAFGRMFCTKCSEKVGCHVFPRHEYVGETEDGELEYHCCACGNIKFFELSTTDEKKRKKNKKK